MMADLLNMEAINSLPHPLYAGRGSGGIEWPITFICVQTGCCTMDVIGLPENFHLAGLIWLIDADGTRHDPDSFYLDSQP
jgi:hypothetical protein